MLLHTDRTVVLLHTDRTVVLLHTGRARQTGGDHPSLHTPGRAQALGNTRTRGLKLRRGAGRTVVLLHTDRTVVLLHTDRTVVLLHTDRARQTGGDHPSLHTPGRAQALGNTRTAGLKLRRGAGRTVVLLGLH